VGLVCLACWAGLQAAGGAGPALAVPESALTGSSEPGDLARLDLLSRFGITPLDSLGPAPTVRDFLGFAVAHNQGISAAYLAWQADRERVPQATALPDPGFSFTEYLAAVETRVGPQERAFALTQTFPWFGKLNLAGRIAEERASASAAKVAAVFLRVAYRVKKAYFDLAHLGRSTAIAAEHLDLVTRLEEAARARYATGAGSYADVIKAQVELGLLTDHLAELRDRYRPLAAELNAALGRPAGAPVPWPTDLSVTGLSLDEGELLRRLPVENPELVGLHHQTQRFEQARKLAGKQGYPDFTLGLNYIQTRQIDRDGIPDNGKDPLLATLSINLPLWRGKYRAAEKEAAGNHLAAHSERQDRESSLTAALEREMFRYRDALRKLDLYGDTLLPKGRQALRATTAAYETGKASFLELVDAQRLLREFELSRARAAADLNIHLAEIERLVGGPVSPGTGATRVNEDK